MPTNYISHTETNIAKLRIEFKRMPLENTLNKIKGTYIKIGTFLVFAVSLDIEVMWVDIGGGGGKGILPPPLQNYWRAVTPPPWPPLPTPLMSFSSYLTSGGHMMWY